MNTINVNLSPAQVRAVCNALNLETSRFSALADNRYYPLDSRDIFRNSANDHMTLSRDLIAAASDDNRNPHVPLVSEAFRGPTER